MNDKNYFSAAEKEGTFLPWCTLKAIFCYSREQQSGPLLECSCGCFTICICSITINWNIFSTFFFFCILVFVYVPTIYSDSFWFSGTAVRVLLNVIVNYISKRLQVLQTFQGPGVPYKFSECSAHFLVPFFLVSFCVLRFCTVQIDFNIHKT